jgi:imidazolonepropionase-like amidohydrolase
MSAEDAIRAATIVPAEMMDMSADVGGVTSGRFADLIAVQGDPMKNVEVLEQVRFVMKGGRVIRDDLTAGR